MGARSHSAAPGEGLRGPGRILLVSCYELGHVPHGLAMPLAFLERAGFDPAAIDLSVDRLDRDAIARARLAVLSVPMHTALRLGMRAIEAIRAINPACRIACFGLYAPLNEELLRRAGVEFVFAGECEPRLVRLAEELGGERLPEPDAPVALSRLSFPQPSRDKLPALRRYAALDRGDGTRVAVGYAETTRGCLDTCRHCPVPAIYGGRFFVVQRDRVLADVEAQVRAGAHHITFGDPDFLNGPGHSLAVLREVADRFPDVTFDITTQITHLLANEARLPELADLGCAFVVSAVESLSDRVLERLKKRHRRADVDRALELCDRAGLAIRPTFVPFTPWTTMEDMRELVDVIADRELTDQVDPVQLSIRLLVPPGSLLLDADDTAPAFGALDPEALTHRWTHPDPRVDELQREVAAVAERDADDGRDPAATHDAIRELVYRAAGERPPPTRPRKRRRIPRVTEPWFC